jgi:hypothetical protein
MPDTDKTATLTREDTQNQPDGDLDLDLDLDLPEVYEPPAVPIRGHTCQNNCY